MRPNRHTTGSKGSRRGSSLIDAGGDSDELGPLPRWAAQPMSLLGMLGQQRAPYLEEGPPPADSDDDCMTVRMQLDQVRTPCTQPLLDRRELIDVLFKIGVQRPNSAMQWADIMQPDADLSTLKIIVKDSAAARQAAREDVAVGAVTVEGYAIPVTWERQVAPPSGCTTVTLHHLPVEYARSGLGVVLLAAAQQDGEVVEEFVVGRRLLGGDRLVEDTVDNVVLWVKTPEYDPMLTKLPSFFSMPSGWPDVDIEVACRPSLAPQEWPARTAEYIRAREAARQVIQRYSQAQQQQPTSQHTAHHQQPAAAEQQQRQQQGDQQQQQPPEGTPVPGPHYPHVQAKRGTSQLQAYHAAMTLVDAG